MNLLKTVQAELDLFCLIIVSEVFIALFTMSDRNLPGCSRDKQPRLAVRGLSDDTIDNLMNASDSSYGSDDDFSSDLDGDLGSSDSDESTASSPVSFDEVRSSTPVQRNDCAATIAWDVDSSSMKKINFTSRTGLRVPPPAEDKPISYFELLANDDFFDMLVKQTNEEATYIFLHESHREQSRISEWSDVTKEEMQIFLGLLFHMGVLDLPRIRDYWSTHRLFNIPCFREYMSK